MCQATFVLTIGFSSFNSPRAIAMAKKIIKKSPANNSSSGSLREPDALATVRGSSLSKKRPPKDAIPSTQSETPSNRVTTSKLPLTAPAKVTSEKTVRTQHEDTWRHQDEQPLVLEDFRTIAKKNLAIEEVEVVDSNKENIERRQSTNSKGKSKKSFLDRQANAERVNFEDSQKSTQRTLGIGGGDIRNPLQVVDPGDEATEETEMEDPSQDEGFQIDDRVINDRRRAAAPPAKRRLPVTASQSPPKRARSTQHADDEIENHLPQSQAENYRLAKMRAKMLAKKVTAEAPKKVQSRTPWTHEEETALIDYIQDVGTSYAYIKKIDEARLL